MQTQAQFFIQFFRWLFSTTLLFDIISMWTISSIAFPFVFFLVARVAKWLQWFLIALYCRGQKKGLQLIQLIVQERASPWSFAKIKLVWHHSSDLSVQMLQSGTESRRADRQPGKLALAKGGERRKMWLCKYVTGTSNTEKYIKLSNTGGDNNLSTDI